MSETMTEELEQKTDDSSRQLKNSRFTLYVRTLQPLICAIARPAACRAGLLFSIQHTEVHTIVHITLALCSEYVCDLPIIRVPEYHCGNSA